MQNSFLTYSVEEIDVWEARHHFFTACQVELYHMRNLTDEAVWCLANMGDKLTDYGVTVFEENGAVYIVRSHYTLPIVAA